MNHQDSGSGSETAGMKCDQKELETWRKYPADMLCHITISYYNLSSVTTFVCALTCGRQTVHRNVQGIWGQFVIIL